MEDLQEILLNAQTNKIYKKQVKNWNLHFGIGPAWYFNDHVEYRPCHHLQTTEYHGMVI